MKIEALKNKKEELLSKLEELAPFACPNYIGDDKEEKSTEYYSVKREFEELRKQINILLDKEVNNKVEDNKKIFVNSFGEATKREITNVTYTRNQKRLSKNMLEYLS